LLSVHEIGVLQVPAKGDDFKNGAGLAETIYDGAPMLLIE